MRLPMKKYTKKRRWKNFIIRNDIQLRMTFYNLLFLFIVIAIVVVATLAPLYAGFQDTENLWAQHFSGKFFIIIIDRLAKISFFIIIIGFVFNLVVSHRFCGPLVSFGKTFQKMKYGDLTRRVYLRRYDYLKPEAAQVNEMMDVLSNKLDDLKQNNLLLKDNLLKMENCGRKDAILEEYITEMKNIVNTNQCTLDQFKTIDSMSKSFSDKLAN